MASEVDICNIALSHIRAGRINSLQDVTIEGQECELKYALMRDLMLESFNWPFAHKIKPLSLSETPVFNWSQTYQYPADCLKINRLVARYEEVASNSTMSPDKVVAHDLRGQIPYEVFSFKTRLICTNLTEARIDYRQRITDPEVFPPAFAMALSYLLAAELAVPVVGAELGRALRKDSLDLYISYLNSATADALNEQYFSPVESEFVKIRS